MSTVVVLGAGVCQVDLINYVASKYNTLVIAPNRPINVRYNFQWICHDACDTQGIINILKNIDIHSVITDQSDHLTRTASIVSGHYNLPQISTNTLKYYCNKHSMYRLCKQYNIPTPSVKKILRNTEYVNSNSNSMVVKPVIGSNSKGIHVVEPAGSVVITTDSLVQPLLQGTEITIEGVCMAGEHTSIIVGVKSHGQFAVANKIRYSTANNSKYKHILKYNDMFVSFTNLQNGLTHSEWIVDDSGDFNLIDFACRGGGCNISSRVLPEFISPTPYELLYAREPKVLNKTDSTYNVTVLYPRVNDIQSFNTIKDKYVDVLDSHIIPDNFDNISVVDKTHRPGWLIVKESVDDF